MPAEECKDGAGTTGQAGETSLQSSAPASAAAAAASTSTCSDCSFMVMSSPEMMFDSPGRIHDYVFK